MLSTLITITITCSDALNLINRLTRVVGLTELQKTEIIHEIRKVVPSCPIKVVKK